MYADLVLTQFGDSPKGLLAQIAAATTNSCVERFMLFQAMAPCGAERTILTTVGPRAFVLECNMLVHAPFLFAFETTVLAPQMLRFIYTKLLFVVDVKDVTRQRGFTFGYK